MTKKVTGTDLKKLLEEALKEEQLNEREVYTFKKDDPTNAGWHIGVDRKGTTRNFDQ